MKSSEFTQLNGQMLYEALDQNNDTGVATDGLVRIVEAHRNNVWSEAIDGSVFLKMLQEGQLPWQK
jgi:hypothetical protein